FEELYGPTGAWAQLFRKAAGYRGTELQRVTDGSSEYRTIDHWESRTAWEACRRDQAAAYESLERRGESLTTSEELVGEWDDAAL
ncbi:MAG: antibiotic biosynthesis monooxygenase, partial [Chloroflexota bacterium]|nr:antibiotic biosynthesis monooxygenase [Chloroflexota bacterium]